MRWPWPQRKQSNLDTFDGKNQSFPPRDFAATSDVDALVYAASSIVVRAPRAYLDQVYTFIGERLKSIDATQLARLDNEVRRTMWSSVFRDLEKSDVAGLVSTAEDPLAPLTILAMHANGYARQAAVARLGALRDERAIPILLIRTRDWVPQVRNEARASLLPLVSETNAGGWVAALPLLTRDSSRGDEELRTQVLDLLRADQAAPALLAAVSTGHATTRRIAAKLALDNPAVDRDDLLATLTQQSDVKTSTLLVDGLLDRIQEDEQRKLLLELIEHRQVRMRRHALLHLARRFPDLAQPLLEDALFDTSSGTRRAAQDALAMTGFDVAGRYRTTVMDRTAQSLQGLAETGSASDTTIAEQHLVDPDDSIRRAAVRVIARHDPVRYRDALVIAVADTTPGMPRAAATGLLRCDLPVEQLWSLLDGAADEVVARNVIRVIRAQAFWIRVHLAMRAVARGKEPLNSWGVAELHDTSLVQVPPMSDEAAREELINDWPVVASQLDKDARQFEFAVRWLRGDAS